MIMLGCSTLFFGIATKKVTPSTVRLYRNTLISYFAMGTVIVPEIFNPFIYNKKWYEFYVLIIDIELILKISIHLFFSKILDGFINIFKLKLFIKKWIKIIYSSFSKISTHLLLNFL